MKTLFPGSKARTKNIAGEKRSASTCSFSAASEFGAQSVTETPDAAAGMNDKANTTAPPSVNLIDYRIFDLSYCRVIMEDQYVCGGRYGQCHRVGHNLTFSRAPDLHAYELRKPLHGDSDANSRSIDGILLGRMTLNDYMAHQSANGALNQQSQQVSSVGPVLDKKKAPEDERFDPFPKYDVLLCSPSKAYLTPANTLYRGLGLPRSLKLDVDTIKGLLHDKLKLQFPNCPRPTFWIGADCVLNEKHWTYKDKEECWKPGTGRTFVLQGAHTKRIYEVVEATDYCILKDNFHKKRPAAAASPATTAPGVASGEADLFVQPPVQSSSNIRMDVAASAKATAQAASGKSNSAEKEGESFGIDPDDFENLLYGMSIDTASKTGIGSESRNSVDALLADVSGMSISEVGTFTLPNSSTIDRVPDAMTIIGGSELKPTPVQDVVLPVESKEEEPLSTLTLSQL